MSGNMNEVKKIKKLNQYFYMNSGRGCFKI